MPADCYDVIVLGAGAGGMTASLVAAVEGLTVLLIEKSPLIGGTTAISGGMVWIPVNSKMNEIGVFDSLENAMTYLSQTVRNSKAPDVLQAFLQNGDRAIRYLEDNSSVRFRPVTRYPDYYPSLPGATLGGRVLEPIPFEGRALGRHFAALRSALPEFMIFGGMMIDRADIPHFLKVGQSFRSALRVVHLVGRYFWQKARNPRGTSLYLGNALAARLFQSLLQHNVTIKLATSVTDLLIDDRAVVGVRIGADNRSRDIRARYGVVLATGGFSHHDAMRKKYLPANVKYSAANGTNRGDGITLGQVAAAHVREGAQNNAFWAPVSRFKRRDGRAAVFPHTVTDRSKPGLIAVNREGHRFTNEARSYHEFVLAMLHANPNDHSAPAYLICDRTFIWKYGLGAIRPFTVFLRHYLDQGYLYRGRDVRDLALNIGIDPETLAATLTRYNKDAAEGRDPEFGRGEDDYQRHLGDAEVQPNPCVKPIDRAPFYAIAVFPGDLGTAAGLTTDATGQVLDDAGCAIPGLYACGNDMASVMEGAYPGPGITLGPALTFGYLVGLQLAKGKNEIRPTQ